MVSEHAIQNAIIRWIALHDHIRVFRQNTGSAMQGGQLVRYGIPGQGDLRCIVAPEGHLWEIEVKTASGKQSKRQQAYARMLNDLGAEYTLARSVEDCWQAARKRWPDMPWRTPAEVME